MATLKMEALEKAHNTGDFDCEVPALNNWLKTVARQHQKNGSSKTFVLIDEQAPSKIIGFIAMAMRDPTPAEDLPPAIRKGLPRAVTGYTLGRLAVSAEFKNQGHGRRLLFEAMEKAYQASELVSGFALFVDAKEGAASFYEKYGFIPFPDDPDTLVYPIASMEKFPGE